jgi:hypothetical protein
MATMRMECGVPASKKKVAGLRGIAEVAVDRRRGKLGAGQDGEVRNSALATGGVDGGLAGCG